MRKLLAAVVVFTAGLFISIHAFGQTVSGTVVSQDDGAVMMGVTVNNETSKGATVTNTSGNFSIKAVKGDQLVFTFVGYTAQTVTVGAQTVIAVKMAPDNSNMDDIIVTGYGQSRSKRSLPYQAPSVSGEELADTRRDNFLNALAGRIPGLQVTSTSGLPGSSAQIMLRSGTSIGGNNAPLFIVDGLPLNDGALNQEDLAQSSGAALANRNSDYSNRIADINPNDIESVVVLKGPEATAQYGSDGASGAIVITTKKGKAGRATITYNASMGLSKVYRYPQLQEVYTRGSDGVFNPDSYNTTYGYRFFGPRYPEGTKFYDNMRNFFQTGVNQNHNLSMTSGTNQLNYRLSAGYFDSKGVVPNSGLRRYTFNLDASAELHKNVSLRAKVFYTNQDNDKVTKGMGSYYLNLMLYPRDIDATDYLNPNGTRKLLRSAGNGSEINNPYWDVNKNSSNDLTNNFNGQLNLDVKLAKGLTASGIFGVNNANSLGYLVYHPESKEYFSVGGYLSTYQRVYTNITGTGRLTYSTVIAKNFTSDLNVGTYFENNKGWLNSQRGERFYEPDFISIMNTDPTSRLATLAQTQTRKARFYGSYLLGYRNIAFLSLTGTREGVSTFMSKFRENQPFFNYGSASGSFVFSDLDFMKRAKTWLSYGKLRFSYATSGKGPILPYVIDNLFRSVTSTGGGFAFGFYANNYNLKPEISKNMEIGGEMKFLNNRLSLDVAWFQTRVKDNIYATRISYATGAILKYVNGGTLQARGWEIQLIGKPVKSRDFDWEMIVNFDKSRSIVKTLPGGLPFYYDSDTWVFGNSRSQVAAGQSLASISGNTFERNSKGQLLINPSTGLPTTSLANWDQIGDRQPDFKLGIVNNIGYKNVSLSFNLDIRKGGDVFNANEMFMTIMGISTRTLDRETPRVIQGVLKDGLEETDNPTVNTIAITPYFRSGYYNGVFAEADYVEEVNWLRMRDITLSYRLGSKIINAQRVFKSASVFATVTDVFMITNYTGMDPNTNALNSSNARGYGGAGFDFGAIPNPRTYNFGLKLTL